MCEYNIINTYAHYIRVCHKCTPTVFHTTVRAEAVIQLISLVAQKSNFTFLNLTTDSNGFWEQNIYVCHIVLTFALKESELTFALMGGELIFALVGRELTFALVGGELTFSLVGGDLTFALVGGELHCMMVAGCLQLVPPPTGLPWERSSSRVGPRVQYKYSK